MSKESHTNNGWILWDYGTNSPFYAEATVYKTEREALSEIADWVITRAQEFIDGRRDDLDLECDAVAAPVTVYPDGFIAGEDFDYRPAQESDPPKQQRIVRVEVAVVVEAASREESLKAAVNAVREGEGTVVAHSFIE
jgi:hypothetical protein